MESTYTPSPAVEVAIDPLRREIAELREEIRRRERMLRVVRRERAANSDPTMKYFECRPLDAILDVLDEYQGRLSRRKVVEKLIAGGITVGRKRGEHNIRISIEKNVELGNLLLDGDILIDPSA